MKTLIRCLAAAALAAGAALSAHAADLRVGVNVALSGPNSSLGIPYSKGMQAALAYKAEVNGHKIQLILLDCGPGPTAAEASSAWVEPNSRASISSALPIEAHTTPCLSMITVARSVIPLSSR